MTRLFVRFGRLIPLFALAMLHILMNLMKLEDFRFSHFAVLYSVMIIFFTITYCINKKKQYPLYVIILFLVISAIPYLYSSPVLSDDAFRYIWEGHVQNRGYNPFLVPPSSSLFVGDSLIAKINFPEIPAVYPPLMQLVFRLLASISLSMWFFKTIFLLAVFLGLVILYKNKGRFKDTFFVWAVLPLTVMETAWSGHFDAVGILLFLVSILFLERSKGLFAGLFLALSVSIKWMPLMFVPLYFFTLPKKERIPFLSLLSIIPFLYLPYLSAGKMLFFALFNFANHWWHDGALFMLLKLIGLSESFSRLILVVLFVISYIVIFFKITEVRNKVYLILLALTHLSPVLWPWYLMWLIPFGVVSFPYTTMTQALLSFASYYSLENGYISNHYAYTVLLSVVRAIIVIMVLLYELKKNKHDPCCK